MQITAVENALNGLELKFRRVAEDQIVLAFHDADGTGFGVRLILADERLSLRAYTTGDFGADAELVRTFTTWWNAHRCVPKAVQANEDFMMDGEVTAWMEGDLFFVDLLPEPYLREWLGLQVGACGQFVADLWLAASVGFDVAA